MFWIRPGPKQKKQSIGRHGCTFYNLCFPFAYTEGYNSHKSLFFFVREGSGLPRSADDEL